jgi:hypothetical protein
LISEGPQGPSFFYPFHFERLIEGAAIRGMSTAIRFIPTPAQLLLAGLGLAVIQTSALAASMPAPVTFKVSQAAEVPSAEYMNEGNINPRTRDMKATEAAAASPTTPDAAAPAGEVTSPATPPPAVASPAVGVEVGQAIPSYRTLGDAAKAGVNPLAQLRSKGPAAKAPAAAASGLKSSLPYALIGLVLLIVGAIGYGVSRARARAAGAANEE